MEYVELPPMTNAHSANVTIRARAIHVPKDNSVLLRFPARDQVNLIPNVVSSINPECVLI